MINKKAQVGKIITTPFVFIIVVVIMALFLVLSAGAAIIKKPGEQKTVSFITPQENLMLQIIEVKLKDGTRKEMLVHDASYLRLNNKIKESDFGAALRDLQEKAGKCYDWYYEIKGVGAGYSSNREGTKFRASYLKGLKDKIITTPFDVETRDLVLGSKKVVVEVEHYFGRCPDE